jgi:lysozyme
MEFLNPTYVASSWEYIRCYLTCLLRQHEFDAIISFCFNLGLGCFQRSTLRQALLRGDKTQAMESLVKYCRAGGKILRGLQIRRLDERALFEGK